MYHLGAYHLSQHTSSQVPLPHFKFLLSSSHALSPPFLRCSFQSWVSLPTHHVPLRMQNPQKFAAPKAPNRLFHSHMCSQSVLMGSHLPGWEAFIHTLAHQLQPFLKLVPFWFLLWIGRPWCSIWFTAECHLLCRPSLIALSKARGCCPIIYPKVPTKEKKFQCCHFIN